MYRQTMGTARVHTERSKTMTRMDAIVRLIHTLDNDLITTKAKFNDIKLYRDRGIITNEEAIDLITAYDIHIAY